jgi:hypothetical protein
LKPKLNSVTGQPDSNRSSFLTTELALGVTFSDIAATNYDAGNLSSAGESMASAEKAYETVNQFLSDPKHVRRETTEQIQDMRAKWVRLRERLDGLLERFKK